MAPQLFALICIAVCIVALFFSFKIYKDTRKMKKKIEEDEEADLRL